MQAQALVEQAEQVAREVASHKAAIRQHRHGLTRAAEKLDQLRRECERRGIRLVLTAVTPKGEGEDPWPNPSSNSTP